MARKPRNVRTERLTDWRFFFQIYLVKVSFHYRFMGLFIIDDSSLAWWCGLAQWPCGSSTCPNKVLGSMTWYWSIINGRMGLGGSLSINWRTLSILDNASSKSLSIDITPWEKLLKKLQLYLDSLHAIRWSTRRPQQTRFHSQLQSSLGTSSQLGCSSWNVSHRPPWCCKLVRTGITESFFNYSYPC